jgi:hypothetical protein
LAVAPLGCAPVLDAQSDLIVQARRGVALAAKAQDRQAQVSEQLAELRRVRLDDAFDADVRDQPMLDVDWVIEARQAYAAALDAYAKQAAAAHASHATARDNLAAVDAALVRLEWLTSLQRRFNIDLTSKEHP